MIKTIIFILLIAIGVVSLILAMIQTAVIWNKRHKSKDPEINKKKQIKLLIVTGVLFTTAILTAFISQKVAHTPTIDAKSDNAISELVEIDINGREEWISIRGKDKDNPIILFLAGGPGGSQLGAVRRNLKDLEDEFVVVNWEQIGSGKSYGAISKKDISIDIYIEDGVALTDYLLERFDKEKIYLMGESWGSALGIFLINEKPNSYFAFIGTGQMVDFEETEIKCYELALEIAKEKGDTKKIKELTKLGKPPYYGEKMALDAAKYLQYLSDEMANDPSIKNSGYETFKDLASKEYGIVDQINFFRGILTTFSNVYPLLYDIDLREEYDKLEVPTYFFIGRHDINAPTYLVEEYYNILDAPDKKLIWFENSGHSPWINESRLFSEKTYEVFTHHNESD